MLLYDAATGKSWEEIEKNLLSGQNYIPSQLILQVNNVIAAKGLSKKFPVFRNLFKIAHKGEKGFVLLL